MGTVMTVSTTFFSNVSPLDSFSASPKQPQSLTGFAMYIHTVISVITAIKASVSRDVVLRPIAKSTDTPNANSNSDSATAAIISSHSGKIPARPVASA